MIKLEHITQTYVGNDGKVFEALKDVSISIRPGEIFGIIGRSGAGKSTLVRCINLLNRPTRGSVIVDGQDLTKLSDTDLRNVRRSIGMIFQHFNLMPSRTIFGNVAYPLRGSGLSKEEIQKKVRSLLELVGIADKENAYPSQLSGGQKQRVAIARALANDPKILLCDEATSALDPQTTKAILRLLHHLNQTLGITIVVITHEMAVVEEICTHVAILDHGVLQESGTVEDIFSNPQTEAGRRLVYPNGVVIDQLPAANVIRIAFNGGSSYEPLIASPAIDCGVKVNILGADTRNIDGKAFGTMLLGLPTDPEEAAKAMAYIKSQPNVTMEEVRDYHG